MSSDLVKSKYKDIKECVVWLVGMNKHENDDEGLLNKVRRQGRLRSTSYLSTYQEKERKKNNEKIGGLQPLKKKDWAKNT